MGLSKTRIEYVLNPDGTPGYSLPILTGCEQPASVCLTRPTCWARRDHHRFWSKWGRLYNPDFSPRLNEGLLKEPFKLRSPAYILVGFTGDAFGPGTDPAWVRKVLDVVKVTPQHTYFFLTKSPENLTQFNPWPPNCLIGCTITGAESSELQQAMIGQLSRIEGGKRWISYEPMLGPFEWPAFLCNFDWLVLGGQSGPRAVKPELSWALNIIEAADKARVKLWIKDNLLRMFPQLPRRQERP